MGWTDAGDESTRDLDPASPLVCFCEVAARDPFLLVGKCERSGFYLADLPRLKVATYRKCRPPWLCLQHDLRERGVDPGRINRVTDRTMGDNLKGVARRPEDRRGADVRAVRVDGPAGGHGNILYAASQTRGPTVYSAFLTTRDSIRRNRVAFAAMVRATRRTLNWIAEHGAEELAHGHAILPGRATRSPYDFASTLPRRGPVGTNTGGVTSRV